MKDDRNADPDIAWRFLSDLADLKGSMEWGDKGAKKSNKKSKQKLKKILQNLFCLYNEDPFDVYENDKKHLSYKTKFHISPVPY